MYSERILESFKNPKNAGGLRGGNGTGKAVDPTYGDIVKIYLLVDEDEVIQIARFKALGGVCTIAASDMTCDILKGKTLEEALGVSYSTILEEVEDIPESKQYSAYLVEEAIKGAVEDYYKKKEKENKNN